MRLFKFTDEIMGSEQTAQKPQKIVNVNVDISETIKDREMGSQM